MNSEHEKVTALTDCLLRKINMRFLINLKNQNKCDELKYGQSLGHFQRSTVDDLDPVQNTRRPAKTYLNQPLFFASVSVKKAVDYVPCSIFLDGRWQSNTLRSSYLYKFWYKAVHFERVP